MMQIIPFMCPQKVVATMSSWRMGLLDAFVAWVCKLETNYKLGLNT